MKLFIDMNFEEKMEHLEKCRLNGLECIRNGEPSNLADIADWLDIWGPWLMDEVKRLNYTYKNISNDSGVIIG
jgi:hypothetical protein